MWLDKINAWASKGIVQQINMIFMGVLLYTDLFTRVIWKKEMTAKSGVILFSMPQCLLS